MPRSGSTGRPGRRRLLTLLDLGRKPRRSSQTGPGSEPATLGPTPIEGVAKLEQARLRVRKDELRKASNLRRYPSREPAPPIPLSRHDTDSYPGHRDSGLRLAWRLQVLVEKPDVPSAPAFLKCQYCRALRGISASPNHFLGLAWNGSVSY